jgi:AcrR family transcriptional regulator
MHSDSTSNRRTPRQLRGEQRLQAILDAADQVIGEKGYEAATMTEIAARSGSSIGALYQYFPNKEALGNALRTRYADDMSERWTALANAGGDLPLDQLAHRIFSLMYAFFEAHPAYFPLLGAPLGYQRSADARDQLRARFALLFQSRTPALDKEDALRIATVALQIVKAFAPLYPKADVTERRLLADEFEHALKAYLGARLR